MCAIVDANVVREVFQPNGPAAGAKFFEWINVGPGRMVAGGELLDELYKTQSFRIWAKEAVSSGRLKVEDKEAVDTRTNRLRDGNSCVSNDHHVIALAQISGARLLYTNDKSLTDDFKNKTLMDQPRGKIYSTIGASDFKTGHRRLLANKTLCGG